MLVARLVASCSLAVFALPAFCLAVVPAATQPGSSSSADPLPDAPGRETAAPRMPVHAARALESNRIRPFSTIGIAVKFGVAGIGFDVATPIAQKFNLRAGASFLNYSPSGTTSDNISYAGTLNLRQVNASLDWFPFGGAFRLSPGVTLYNGNKVNANATIAAGQTFDLGDQSYQSGYLGQDPVHGTLDLSFGKKVAPSITAGFGNLVPRGLGRHFSVPFEFGVQFSGAPKFQLALSGIACQAGQPQPEGCAPVNSDSTTQSNIIDEQNELNSDVSGLRFYPILSIGFGYKF